MGVLQAVADSLRESFLMVWETFWALALGFTLSGLVQAFIPRRQMERALGGENFRSVGLATFFGLVSSSCSYAATSMANSLLKRGASFMAAMAFMFASTNLVIELGIVLVVLLGWQFMASEFFGGLVMIALMSGLIGLVLPRKLKNSAGYGGQEVHHSHMHGADDAGSDVQTAPLIDRLSQAARYTVSDISMLKRELIIGFVVAGFLATVVPKEVWGAVFISGHGWLTSVENAIVGPFIAIISFVCSIGNVPLAAALWNGGISFGGVVSFIFADLITFPLLMIYRKYYGLKTTLWMLGLFWVAMTAAALITELVFSAAGWIPAHRTAIVASTTISLNYTAFLNIALFAVIVAVFMLARRPAVVAGVATDPVCGMQVETATAAAHTVKNGVDYWFCSQHCLEKFESAHPPAASVPKPLRALPTGGKAVDPICGMEVDIATAPAHAVRDGQDYYFCCEGCQTKFETTAAKT